MVLGASEEITLRKLLHRGSARRSLLGGWVMAAVAIASAGVSAHGSGATVPPATGAGVASPVQSLGVPEPTTSATSHAPTTITTQPPPTTTTTMAPSSPPTTAPPTTTTTAAPTRQAAAVAEPSRQEQIEAIADGTGWDWRAAGVRLVVGFFPGDCCHWGVYESAQRTVWIGPTAFSNPNRLRYVVLHELAHGWQYTRNRFTELIADYQPYGRSTPAEALEAGGDCIATLWGAADHHYWECPASALRTAARRLAGDWS
jgi:hypothetical protein